MPGGDSPTAGPPVPPAHPASAAQINGVLLAGFHPRYQLHFLMKPHMEDLSDPKSYQNKLSMLRKQTGANQQLCFRGT